MARGVLDEDFREANNEMMSKAHGHGSRERERERADRGIERWVVLVRPIEKGKSKGTESKGGRTETKQKRKGGSREKESNTL